jgi:N-acetylmuramoyl-L-alanine amidase
MISQNDKLTGIQRIKRDSIVSIMQKYAAPTVLAERDPREYYDVCVRYNFDALFALAMFQHESQMGRAGTAMTTHSWGNTRLPSFGVDPVVDDKGAPAMAEGRSGTFPIYRNWKDGLESTVARLTTSKWHYAGRTIGEVFLGTTTDTAAWAPAGDLNNPDGYLAGVLAFMNAHADVSTTNSPGGNSVISKPSVVSKPSPNRGGYAGTRRADAVVWHITQGSGASALSWLTNPAAQASANFMIDRDGTIYELVPADESAWANGAVDKPNTANSLISKWLTEGVNFNQRTISIEHAGMTSSNKGGSLSAAQIDATIRLTAWLCQQFGIPADQDHILGHFEIDSINRPYCPGFSAGEWNDWTTRVASLVRNGGNPGGGIPGVDKGVLLKESYALVPSWAVGNILYEATADLSEFGLPTDCQCLVCEKSVFWTDGNHVDGFHRGQYEGLVARNKVSEWK